MAEKTLKTRLLLKQDTLENWNNSTLPLKKGEVVFATTTINSTPITLAKVCTTDNSFFKDLDFNLWCKSADVPTWAKKNSIEFTKIGTGNVISSLDFVDDKIQYTTTSVATSEALSSLQSTVDTLNSKVSNNEATWAKDTTYTFALTDGQLVITPSSGTATTLDLVTPAKLTEAINAAKLSVASGDKTLSITNNTISSTLNLTYDSTTKKIKLLGISDAVIAEVDATDFIKDGMVDNVSFDASTKQLTITFNTASGKEAINVDLTSLVDTYTAGNGITLSNNVISAKIDTASESFLTVSSSGIKLSGVQSAIQDARNDAVQASAFFAESLASNYATVAQGTKADTALQTIAAGTGLKVSAKADSTQTIEIDDSVTFIFDCGDASNELIVL